MVDFDYLGKDILDRCLILDQPLFVASDEGDQKLYVRTHQRLVLLAPVLTHQQRLVDSLVLRIRPLLMM